MRACSAHRANLPRTARPVFDLDQKR
jgi:hypothetical protein